MAEPKRYLIRLWDMDKPESDLHPTYPMVHYYEYSDMRDQRDALKEQIAAERGRRTFILEEVVLIAAGAAGVAALIVTYATL